MKFLFKAAVLVALSAFLSLSAFAQQRSIGAHSLILDDGTGHTLTIQPFSPMSTNQVFVFPSVTTYTPGSVLFADGNGSVNQNNSKFFWDNTNFRLGLGTINPPALFSVGSGNPFQIDNVGDVTTSGTVRVGSLLFNGNGTSNAITTDKELNISTTSNDLILLGTNNNTRVTIAKNGFVGIGTQNPQSALHIVATTPDPTFKDATGYFYVPDPVNHVLTVENTQTDGKGNGIAIIIHNPASTDPITDGQSNNEASNYLTFYNDDGTHSHIRGRVESFSYQNFNDMVAAVNSIVTNTDLYNPFNYFTCNLGFDQHFMDNSFNSGFLDNVFTLPTFPTFDPGSFPSLSFTDLEWHTPDDFPNVDLGDVLPNGFTGGSLPSLTGGSVGSICFNCIQNPINFSNITSPITNLTNPFSLNTTFIDGILDQVKSLPYKQKIIDIFSNGPQAAIVKAAATYAMSFFAGGVTYESGSGDYAEWLERANHDETITIGDVVGVVGGKITKNTEGASQLMVASFKPCVLGNMPEEGKEPYFNKVAFMGQVPVKMMTPVRKGDYIIPDGRNNGFAKAIAPEDITSDDLDKVLGVSWQDDLQYGVKFVNIAVGLKPHEMVKVIQDQQKELDDLKAQIAEIRSEITSVHVTSHSKKSAKRSKELSAN